MIEAEFGDGSTELAAHLEAVAERHSRSIKTKRATTLLQRAVQMRTAQLQRAAPGAAPHVRATGPQHALARALVLAAEHSLRSQAPRDAAVHGETALEVLATALGLTPAPGQSPELFWTASALQGAHAAPPLSQQLGAAAAERGALRALRTRRLADVAAAALLVLSRARLAARHADAVGPAVAARACAKFAGGSHSLLAVAAHAQICSCTVVGLAHAADAPLQPGVPLSLRVLLEQDLPQRVTALCNASLFALAPAAAPAAAAAAGPFPALPSPRPALAAIAENSVCGAVAPLTPRSPRDSVSRFSIASRASVDSAASIVSAASGLSAAAVLQQDSPTAAALQACSTRLKKCVVMLSQRGVGVLDELVRCRLDRAHLLLAQVCSIFCMPA